MTTAPQLIHVAAWTGLWCILHSLLIADPVRVRLRALFPRWQVAGRLLYVVFASVSLALLAAWVRTVPEVALWAWPGWWEWVRIAGLAEAGFLFWLGARAHDGRTFLGLSQLRDHLAGREPASAPFRTDGILGVIRHPWYTGALVFLVFCLPFTDVNLVWRGIGVLYVLVGTELEERKLLREIGPDYAAYRARVPRFLPLKSGRPPS